MAKFITFKDENGNTLSSYINSEENVFILISDDNECQSNFITLDIDDLIEFIKHLQDLKMELKKNIFE